MYLTFRHRISRSQFLSFHTWLKQSYLIWWQEGCRVCVSDVDTTKGLETKLEFQKQFGLDENGVCFVKCDVSVKEDWQKLWDTAEKMLEGPIEVLVNNAGVHPGVSIRQR